MSKTEKYIIWDHVSPVYEIGLRIPFLNNTGMVQIIGINMLLITTFVSVQLPSYCLLCALQSSMPISPETHLQLL